MNDTVQHRSINQSITGLLGNVASGYTMTDITRQSYTAVD